MKKSTCLNQCMSGVLDVHHTRSVYMHNSMDEAFYFRRPPVFSFHFPVFHCINLDVFPFAGWPLCAAAAVWRSAAAVSGDVHA